MMKRMFVVLAVCALLLSGCSSSPSSSEGSGAPAASEETAIEKEALDYIKEHVEENLAGYDVESVTVLDQHGKATLTAKLHGGMSGVDFGPFAEAASSALLEAVEEKGVKLGEVSIQTKNAKGEMLNWRSTDGETGTLVDNRDGKKDLFTGVKVDEIGEKLNGEN